MNDQCIGIENKDNIRDLKEKIKLLELEVKHVKSNMVTTTTLHELEMKIGKLQSDINEMKNNRKEDREAIRALRESIEEVGARLEEYLSGNMEILSNQKVAGKEQEFMKTDISDIKDMIKSLSSEIDSKSIANQLKMFSEKNKINKWILRLSGFLLIVLVVSVFSFFATGGKTFFELLELLKGVIM